MKTIYITGLTASIKCNCDRMTLIKLDPIEDSYDLYPETVKEHLDYALEEIGWSASGHCPECCYEFAKMDKADQLNKEEKLND